MSDEEKKAIEYFKRKITNKKTAYTSIYFKIKKLDTLIDLIEKQSKEIEELKVLNKMQEYRIDEMDIPKSVAEQKERKAYIKGTNDADELCNKKWEDKIKAKIEELKDIYSDTCKKIFDSERPYWTEIIQEVLQSLLEKE